VDNLIVLNGATPYLRKSYASVDGLISLAARACVRRVAVTEPCSTGLGGDCFMLYYEASSKQVIILCYHKLIEEERHHHSRLEGQSTPSCPAWTVLRLSPRIAIGVRAPTEPERNVPAQSTDPPHAIAGVRPERERALCGGADPRPGGGRLRRPRDG
jgi:hypothetical protein